MPLQFSSAPEQRQGDCPCALRLWCHTGWHCSTCLMDRHSISLFRAIRTDTFPEIRVSQIKISFLSVVIRKCTELFLEVRDLFKFVMLKLFKLFFKVMSLDSSVSKTTQTCCWDKPLTCYHLWGNANKVRASSFYIPNSLSKITKIILWVRGFFPPE